MNGTWNTPLFHNEMFIFFLAILVTFFIESFVFLSMLNKYSTKRIIGVTILANLFSFVISFISYLLFWSFSL